MDSSDSWESILSELDLTDHRQDLVAGGYDHFKAVQPIVNVLFQWP